MAAIDLYSGIGGWTLGLKMAGIPVLASYEWWKDANNTHSKNFNSNHSEVNIRELQLGDLPDKSQVKYVVGSPPCTQFSLANRGGKGNIADGLVDINKFLEIVEYMEPKYWAMENVPRVASILEHELRPGGMLSRFKYLFSDIRVLNSADFGVPQDRKRMIAGKLSFDLLDSYKKRTPSLDLKDVISALDQDIVLDPIYKIKMPKCQISDHILEPNLSIEESRMNKEAKTHHPVYNKMQFPDNLNRPSRTITALCTRVSRESIVINDYKENIRRLTIRERGCIQSFPITYQFFSNTYAGKIKMIGNAVPPLLTFYIAQCMNETPANKLILPDKVRNRINLSKEQAVSTTPDNEGKKYSSSRSFWMAIPGLRFGSGMRFELKNRYDKETKLTSWAINFFYGNSKDIKQLNFDETDFKAAIKLTNLNKDKAFGDLFLDYSNFIAKIDVNGIQMNWTNNDRSKTGPIAIVDYLGILAKELHPILQQERFQITIKDFVTDQFKILGVENDNKKISTNSTRIFAGLLIATYFNACIAGRPISIVPTSRLQKVKILV